MTNQPIPKDFIDALRQFEEAAFELLNKWPYDDGNTVIPNLYPFPESFDELCLSIADWREDCEQNAGGAQ